MPPTASSSATTATTSASLTNATKDHAPTASQLVPSPSLDDAAAAADSSATTSGSQDTSPGSSPARDAGGSSGGGRRGKKAGLPNDILSISDDELAAAYSFQKEIGFGNWGSIWKCQTRTYPRHERKTVALKLVHRDKSDTTAARVRSLWGEFKILRVFKSDTHPNVLRVHSFIITPSYALLAMAHHPHVLHVGPQHNPEGLPRTRRYLSGIAKGLAFLHEEGVAHNDVKPANVVVSASDEPVLIDFGFATSYGASWRDFDDGAPGGAFWSDLSWGTPEYLSPERASGKWHDERLSDVWALGVTMYELLVGRTPFERDETEEFLTKDSLKEYYLRTLEGKLLGEYKISPLFEDLVKRIIRKDVGERLGGVEEVLRHPYFAEGRRTASTSASGGSIAKSFSTSAVAEQLARPPTHKRVAQLTGTPTKPKRAPPTAAIAEEQPSPAKVGTPSKAKRVLRVFEDSSSSSAAVGASPRKTGTPGRKVLAERTNAVATSTPSKAGLGVGTPTKTRVGEKRGGGGKAEGGGAKENEDGMATVRAEGKKPAPKAANDLFTPNDTEEAAGDLSRRLSSMTLADKVRPSSSGKKRLDAVAVGEGAFADATGEAIRETVAALELDAKQRPVQRLRKRAPTTSSAVSAPRESTESARPSMDKAPGSPLKAVFGRVKKRLPSNARPPPTTGAKKTVQRQETGREEGGKSSYAMVEDKRSLALDRDAPGFEPSERIEAFRATIDDIVRDAHKDGAGKTKAPEVGEGKGVKGVARRASIATGSPTSSPESGMEGWAQRPIIRPSKLRQWAKKAEEARAIQVRQSFELKPATPSRRPSNRRVPSITTSTSSSSLKMRLSATPGARSIGPVTPGPIAETEHTQTWSDGSTPKQKSRQATPKQLTIDTSAASLKGPVASNTAASDSRSDEPRSASISSFESRPMTAEDGRRSSSVTTPSTAATSGESIFAQFIAATPRVKRTASGPVRTSTSDSASSTTPGPAQSSEGTKEPQRRARKPSALLQRTLAHCRSVSSQAPRDSTTEEQFGRNAIARTHPTVPAPGTVKKLRRLFSTRLA